MAGKYDKVIHNLPRTFGIDEPGRQDKIDALKPAIVAAYHDDMQEQKRVASPTPPASWLAREWADLRYVKDDLEKKLKDVETQLDAFTQMMVDQYEVEGIDKLHLDTGEAPRVQYEPYASVEDSDAFRKWCLEHGYERSLQLPWQTRTSIAKEHLLNGEDLPPGLKVWNKPKIVKQ